MPTSPDSSSEARLLFCPFCRECYEGEEVCPVHELALVDFIDLPKQAHERVGVGGDDVIAPWDPRFGRGLLAAGVVLATVGFFLPFAVGTFDDRPTVWTALDLATGPAPNLWSIPFGCAVLVTILYRRLTPHAMRGARLAAVLIAITPGFSLIYSMRNVLRGVEQLHGAVGLSWGAGVYATGLACALMLVGAFRLGALPRSGGPRLREDDGEDEERGIDAGTTRRRRRR